jgi:hypothetical protein
MPLERRQYTGDSVVVARRRADERQASAKKERKRSLPFRMDLSATRVLERRALEAFFPLLDHLADFV